MTDLADRTVQLYRIMGSTEAADYALREALGIIKTAGSIDELRKKLASFAADVIKARPTSALMLNTFRDILMALTNLEGVEPAEARRLLAEKVESWIARARESVEKLAEIGARRIPDETRILTHSYSYSVVRTLEKCVAQGKRIEVVVTESRPTGEGLATAETLSSKGIPVTLIVDSAARFIMKDVDLVLMGAEAIAANGAVVNKVGSSLIALAAHEARRRVFIAAGTYKFSVETVFGELVEIPSLPPRAVLSPEEAEKLGDDYKAWFPLMDVTPPEYIDAIITEMGMVAPEAVPLVLRELYGSWPPRLPDIDELLERLSG